MEYVQLTIDDWLRMKEELKDELIGVKRSFVRIGYRLRRIRDERLYERDGYKSIAEFAYSEYRLKPHTVSRMIAINEAYSLNGYSDELRPEYANVEQSKLEEMLQLPEGDREIIRPEVKRESIRDLKQFNRQSPEIGVADEVQELIKKFFDDNVALREELLNSEAYHIGNVTEMVEIINPSGNRTYRKGLFFVVMYEDNLKIKKHGGTPETMTWEVFFDIFGTLFHEDEAPEVEIVPAQNASEILGAPEIIDVPETEEIMEISEANEQNSEEDVSKTEESVSKTEESVSETEGETPKTDETTHEETSNSENPSADSSVSDEIKTSKKTGVPDKTEHPTPSQRQEEPVKMGHEVAPAQMTLKESRIKTVETLYEHLGIAIRNCSWDMAVRKMRTMEELVMQIRAMKEEDKNQMQIGDYPGVVPEGGNNE